MSWLTPLGLLGLIGLIVLIIIYIIKPIFQNKIISSTYVWKGNYSGQMDWGLNYLVSNKNTSTFKQPSNCCMFGESTSLDSYILNSDNCLTEWGQYSITNLEMKGSQNIRHGENLNITYLDGHVGTYKRLAIPPFPSYNNGTKSKFWSPDYEGNND